MIDKCYKSQGKSDIAGIELETVWEVCATPEYKNSPNWKPTGKLIAIRTWNGKGVLTVRESELRDIILSANSLALVEHHKIVRYYCASDTWRFLWFEFFSNGVLSYPMRKALYIPILQDEEKNFKEISVNLISSARSRRSMASALFSALLYRWFVGWNEENKNPHIRNIERVIAEMYKRISGFSIKEMASMAYLSPRRFRQIFTEINGMPPKQYYDRIRLQTAETLLRLGNYKVAEISDRLGFSSQFHFCRVFKNYFGYPPSKILTNKSAGKGK